MLSDFDIFTHNFINFLFNPLLAIPIIFAIVFIIKKIKRLVIKIKQIIKYKNSSYYEVTKKDYKQVIKNKGVYGEYLTYEELEVFEKYGAKFLFNLYIPKEKNETTEIDLLMICSKGIFVFESKNYSGWIFGSENQKNWCQTLPIGYGYVEKDYFYNPVLQNRTHIKHLKSIIGEDLPFWSIIVFSVRCELKSINIKSSDLRVIKRNELHKTISDIYELITDVYLDEEKIKNIYLRLYPYTQIDESIKQKHINNIVNNHSEKLEPPK